MKKKKGFTLVELLAVIVILAVILIIAVPQIMSVIESARKGSIESTAKLIAEGAEREYTNRKILGKDTNIKCSDVSSMNNNDYGTCSISFDNSGKATVSITGKGKFEGYTCKGNSTNMECIKGDSIPTDAQYFSYVITSSGRVKVTIEDKDKCVAYLQTNGAPEENANTLCVGDIDTNGNTIQNLVYYFDIPSGDYEMAGLNVEWITINNVKVKDKDKCTSYIASSSLNDTIKANADTLCAGGKTTDGDTMQNLVVFDNILSSDYETAGLEIDYIKVEDVVVKDKDKCVNYHITSAFLGYTEEDADTICSGNATGGWTIRDNVLEGDIPSSDYEIAGLEVTSKPYTEKIIDEISITGYNIKGGLDVVIPSMIDGKKVVEIGDFAFTNSGVTPTNISSTNKALASYLKNNKNRIEASSLTGQVIKGLGITSVIIPDTIRSIGLSAFEGNQLTEITIPSSVTHIGESAFHNNQLKEVTIPSSVTNIMRYAFAGNQLTSVTISNGVTNIGQHAFEGNQLTEITIPSSVTHIGESAFHNNQLKEVTIPSSVTNIMRYAFAGNQLTSVTISNGVTNIGQHAFEGNQLAEVTIPSSVTSIGESAFRYNQLTSITFPKTSLTISCYAFKDNPITNDGTYKYPSNVIDGCPQ